MRRLITWSIALGFLVTATLPAWAVGDNWKLVVNVKGTVESQQAGASDWTGIWESRLLPDGAKARTLADSRAKIRLADQSVITVGADTQVELADFKLTLTSRVVQLNLSAGKIRVNVAKFAGTENTFIVRTPTATLAARGTDFFIYQKKMTKDGTFAGVNEMFICEVFNGDVSGRFITPPPVSSNPPPGNSFDLTGGMGLIIGAGGGVQVFNIYTGSPINITDTGAVTPGDPTEVVPIVGDSAGPDGDLGAPNGLNINVALTGTGSVGTGAITGVFTPFTFPPQPPPPPVQDPENLRYIEMMYRRGYTKGVPPDQITPSNIQYLRDVPVFIDSNP